MPVVAPPFIAPMHWRRCALVAAALAGAAAPTGAAVGEAWLPNAAFRVPAPCALDPFLPLGAQRIERILGGQCRHAKPAPGSLARGSLERDGNQTEGHLRHTASWAAASLSARLRLGVALRASAHAMRAHSDLAAGLWWRPDRRWALNLGYGDRRHADGATDQQLSVTSVWRPTNAHVLFSRWRAVDDSRVHELGLRWWLWPRRVSFDLVWPTGVAEPEGAAMQLRWRGFEL